MTPSRVFSASGFHADAGARSKDAGRDVRLRRGVRVLEREDLAGGLFGRHATDALTRDGRALGDGVLVVVARADVGGRGESDDTDATADEQALLPSARRCVPCVVAH